MRNEMMLTDERGESTTSQWDFLSWEAKDSLRYRFFATLNRGEEEPEKIIGEARLEHTNHGGEALFTQPEQKTFALPPGTLFPTDHTLFLLRKAVLGETIIRRPVFDGTDVSGVFDVNAVIDSLVPAGKDIEQEWPLLACHPSWRVRMAYFRSDSADDLPAYEIGARYHANGIGREIVQDYADFRVKLNLKTLTPLPKPDCQGHF